MQALYRNILQKPNPWLATCNPDPPHGWNSHLRSEIARFFAPFTGAAGRSVSQIRWLPHEKESNKTASGWGRRLLWVRPTKQSD